MTLTAIQQKVQNDIVNILFMLNEPSRKKAEDKFEGMSGNCVMLSHHSCHVWLVLVKCESKQKVNNLCLAVNLQYPKKHICLSKFNKSLKMKLRFHTKFNPNYL